MTDRVQPISSQIHSAYQVNDPKSQKCVGGIFTKSTLKKIALRQMFSFSIPVIDLFSTKLLTKHQTLLLSSTVSIRIKYGAVM